MSKKIKSPYIRLQVAKEKISTACKERDKLDKYHRWDFDYEIKRKELTREIAEAIDDRDLAKQEILNQTVVPQFQDNSKRTIIQTEINVKSKNKKEFNASASFGKTGNNSSSLDKKPSSEQQTAKKHRNKFLTALGVIALCVVCGAIIAGIVILALNY